MRTPITCECNCFACHGLTLEEHCSGEVCRTTAVVVGSPGARGRQANRIRRIALGTRAELDALPVGSIVMTLWDPGPLHHVLQKYSDGWYGFPSKNKQFPLGSGRRGETVALLWRG